MSTKNRRLVEEFIFRDDQPNQTKSKVPLNLIILPQLELRYYIDPDEVEKIVASARKNGILEPLLVRPISDERYEIVAGAKRYRAAQILELTEVPVVIRELDDQDALEIALIENFARSGLTDLEETDGVLRLLSMKLNLAQADVPGFLYRMQNQLRNRLTSTNNVIGEDVIALVNEVLTSLGNIKLDSFISNRLPLLNLPTDILEVLRQGKLETSKAKAIAAVQDEAQRKELVEGALAHGWSLNEIKQQIKKLQDAPQAQLPESSLKERVDSTLRQLKKSKVLDNPKKAARVEKLLTQLETLIASEEVKKRGGKGGWEE